MTTTDLPARWALKHAWNSPSDRAALALCAEALARIGVAFAEATDLAEADAVKLHGFELVEARREARLPLSNLQAVAEHAHWATRVDPRAWRFMAQQGVVHGIPLAIHQSNCAWANIGLAEALASEAPAESGDLVGWLRKAARKRAAPLAIGREPWQVGILFESLALACLGADRYRRAFVDLDPGVLGGPEMTRTLESLREAREFVDDARLDAPWRTLLADVGAGRAAVMLMGDWVQASGLPLRRLEPDGLRDSCVHIVDLFVPVGPSPHAAAVAAALTAPEFQARFARTKGSRPAVVDAGGEARQGAAQAADVPSLTFDQCCGVRTKQALLEVVAEHFLCRHPAARTAARLAALASAQGEGAPGRS